MIIIKMLHFTKYSFKIFDFLHFPARNKMYEGVAGVHFDSAGKCKKSEMLYVT